MKLEKLSIWLTTMIDNGFGGKVEENETILEGAIRELQVCRLCPTCTYELKPRMINRKNPASRVQTFPTMEFCSWKQSRM